jgi:PAS domain S-box-containing protein
MKHLIQALSKASDAAFVINEDFRIVYWNEAAESILGFTAEHAIGQYCYELLGGRDENGRTFCQRFCPIALNALRGRIPPNSDIYTSATVNEGRWINLSTFAYPTDVPKAGNVIVHLFRDATRKRSAELFAEEVVEASKKLRRGNPYSTPPNPRAESPSDPKLSALTRRERQVLLLLARGLGTAEIADTLTVSPSTARNHIQSILLKLGAHSRLEAVTYAYQHGLMDLTGQ